jgi:AcrR family transcriptional regulator
MARRPARAASPSSRSSPPKERKQEIVDAAARVFYEKSYHGASIQDVADEVGILKGSLYYYIDNKEDLLFETLNDQNDRYWAVLNKAQKLTGPALDKLRFFIREHLRVVTKDVLTTTVFFRDFQRLSEERRRPILESRRAYEKAIVDLVGQAQREGSIAPDLDPALTVRALFGMLNWSYTWYKPRGAASPDDLATLYVRILLGGVATERPVP